jgi:cyclopropane fatty-acyl-phospholipid synthase-like methyltransferase
MARKKAPDTPAVETVALACDAYNEFYKYALYYDVAFNRDVSGEAQFIKDCFAKYAPEIENPVRILEPACGTGIWMEQLPKFGFYPVGYDLSPEMVQFTKERIAKAGLEGQADAVVGNMKDITFEEKSFDGAIVVISSLSYLNKEEDLVSHFTNTAAALKDGGLYICEIFTKPDDFEYERGPDDTWDEDGCGVHMTLTWETKDYDLDNMIRHIHFAMHVVDGDTVFDVDEIHNLRLWTEEDFIRMSSASGFKLVGIYDQQFQEVSMDQPITGELGALFHVLKKE